MMNGRHLETGATHNFGGFNAKAYDHVFELLLRLKGNYLWPAMWSARFADDGPDLLNAELQMNTELLWECHIMSRA